MQISSNTTSRRNFGMLNPDCSGFMLIVSLAADTIGSITSRQHNRCICFTSTKTTAQRTEKRALCWVTGTLRKLTTNIQRNTCQCVNYQISGKLHSNQCKIPQVHSQYMWSTFFVVSAMLSFMLVCTSDFSFVLNVSEPQFQYTDKLSSSINWNIAHHTCRDLYE